MKVLSIEFTSNYIYLYEQNVDKGVVTVLSKNKIETPQNSYYNRMLVNNDRSISDVIKNCISEKKIKCKKAILIAPSTDNMVEEFSLVNAKKKEMDQMVMQELRKRHKLSNDYIYDYIILGPDPLKQGFVKIQVTLCIKNMILGMEDILKKAGLTPYKVIFVNRAMERLAEAMHLSKANNSAIIACVNGDEAHFLYVGHNEEPYYRYSRLKTENHVEENLFVLSSIGDNQLNLGDSEEVVHRKIMDDLIRLERFHKQRHPDEKPADVYFYGSYEKFKDLERFLKTSIDIDSKELPFSERAMCVKYKCRESELMYNAAAAALMLEKEETEQYDFFGATKEEGEDVNLLKFHIPTIIGLTLFAVIMILTVITKHDCRILEKQNEELETWINDPEVISEYNEKNELLNQTLELTKYNQAVSDNIENLENMPRFESSVVDELNSYKPSDVTITGFNFTQGNMSISCYTADQNKPAEFAKNLEESQKYIDVTYTGFSKTEDMDGKEIYTFNINFKLWEEE